MKKANLTLYCATGKPVHIPEVVKDKFQEVTCSFTRENGQMILTLQDSSSITFTLKHKQDDPDFIASHIEGMANYFATPTPVNKELQQNVIRQILSFNCITGIVFTADDNADRTNYILNTLFDVAQEINGFLLYPGMRIYNGLGQLVFSAQGETELSAFTPIADAGIKDAGDPRTTEPDNERRERSIKALQERNIPYIPHLPCIIPESRASFRSREEMLQRAVALFAVAVYSEVMLSETPDREEALGYIGKLDEIYNVTSYFTPAENSYLAHPAPDQQECVQFLWRYECCATLLWASGIVEELPYPSEICDVPVIGAILWQQAGLEELLSKGFPRTDTEILDTADITLRYDWACVDARTHDKEAPASLDGGIVMERRYAFNWIIGTNENSNWDNIQLYT